MKTKLLKMCTILLTTALLFGCSPTNNSPEAPAEQPDNNAAGAILAGADQAKNINAEDVVSIELYDLEDKEVEKELDTQAIVEAFNKSSIDDTAYIAMITGYRMVISLKDNTTISLSSYGDDSRVVAATENASYHLISPELAEILLDKN